VVLIFILLAVLSLGVALVLTSRPPAQQSVRQPAAQPAPAISNTSSASATTNAMQHPVSPAVVAANYPDFQQRPFPVAFESPAAQWTLADGRDTNIIRQLAHNPLEYDRMVEENSRIFRRQLVYLKATAASVFEQARLTGGAVQQLTLPGMDGQELKFEIVKSDNKGSSRQGMFSGHLAGNNDSLVTLAFQDGREAFTVLSPKENIFVVGEPREDGQVIIKDIDPNTYGVGPAQGDDSIKTAQPGK